MEHRLCQPPPCTIQERSAQAERSNRAATKRMVFMLSVFLLSFSKFMPASPPDRGARFVLAAAVFLVLFSRRRNQAWEALIVDDARELTSPARQLADRSVKVDIHDLPAG